MNQNAVEPLTRRRLIHDNETLWANADSRAGPCKWLREFLWCQYFVAVDWAESDLEEHAPCSIPTSRMCASVTESKPMKFAVPFTDCISLFY
jgi:hypothetical protein